MYDEKLLAEYGGAVAISTTKRQGQAAVQSLATNLLFSEGAFALLAAAPALPAGHRTNFAQVSLDLRAAGAWAAPDGH